MRAAGVESRYALFRELGVLGETVFINAAPFLRVRRTGNDSMTNTDILVRRRSSCVVWRRSRSCAWGGLACGCDAASTLNPKPYQQPAARYRLAAA